VVVEKVADSQGEFLSDMKMLDMSRGLLINFQEMKVLMASAG